MNIVDYIQAFDDERSRYVAAHTAVSHALAALKGTCSVIEEFSDRDKFKLEEARTLLSQGMNALVESLPKWHFEV